MVHGGDIYRNNIRMDFSVNLNPCGAPEEVYEAIRAGLDHLGEYPDPEQESVKRALACADGVDPANILAGNGASEIIMGVMSYVNPKCACLPIPCFDGYRHALAPLTNCRVADIPLCVGAGFDPDDDFIERIPADTDMICLCDPWNPTGRNIDETLLKSLLELSYERGIKVLLDESFYSLSDKAADTDEKKRDIKSLIKRCPGLFIVRSYTKLFGLPGIRMGYLISNERNITGVRMRLPEWNLSQPSAYAMEACARIVARGDHIIDSLGLIRRERQHLSAMLEDTGCRVYESDTVFVMIYSDVELYRPLLKEGILIRDLSEMPGAGPGYYRIAVRDAKSNAQLAEAIRQIRK